MKHIDVFNGDADGICALHQLRLAHPVESTLITGKKREISLLERVAADAGDHVTVLDISLARNRAALDALLERGVTIDYFDHHRAGDIPDHPRLRAVIEPLPKVCTGMLVDRHLEGRHRPWAIVAAFGDNLAEPARGLASMLGLSAQQTAILQELGECLNYNAYGDSDEDLLIHPKALYELVHGYADPFAFTANEPVFQTLREAEARDLESAQKLHDRIDSPGGAIVILPDAAWSRRVRGAYANALATSSPEKAHALMTPDALGGYAVSVRAPLATMRGADQLCVQFTTGGGRPAAAGIDHLPREQMEAFSKAFAADFG